MKLSEQQISFAKCFIRLTGGQEPSAKKVMELAANLQIQLEPPTGEEVDEFRRKWNLFAGTVDATIRHCLIEFIIRRNATLLPKPVDPRLEIVREVLTSFWGCNINIPNAADEICGKLAALDVK